MKRRIGVICVNAMILLLIVAPSLYAHGEDGNPTTVTRSDWIAQIPMVFVMIGVTLLVNYLFIAQIRKANKQAEA